MAEEKKAGEAQEEVKSKKMMFIIIGLVALVLLGGGGAAAVMLMGGETPTPDSAAEQADAVEAPADQSYLVNLDSFVCNLADPKGDRFMKATLRVVVSEESLTERIRTDDLFRTRLRDKALSVLSSKRFQDVNNPLGKESLRRELVREFDQIFPPGTVKEVLFVEFVIQ